MEPQEQVPIEVTVNDETYRRTTPANAPLSQFLREELNLTGTHRGCETAKCGACTVLFDGEAVKSCNLLAAQAHGHEVTTVEGLADGSDLHPVQESFWECHGMQCGYCTPGFVMSTAALLEDTPDPDTDDIMEGLTGNVCRCTGYTKIIDSVKDAAERVDDE